MLHARRPWAIQPFPRAWTLIGSALAVLVPMQPGARACSIPPRPLALSGFPADGATGVPTDVIPIFDVRSARVPDEDGEGAVFHLTSESGEPVAVTFRRSHAWHFELVPSEELAPGTRYTLTGRWKEDPDTTDPPVELSLSFTTDDGPLREPPQPPAAVMYHFVLPDATCQVMCDCPLKRGTCVVRADDLPIEYVYSGSPDFSPGGHRYLYIQPGMVTNLTGIDQTTSDRCVRLRTRGANGTHSQPLVLCRDDAPTVEVRGDVRLLCTADGLMTNHGQVVGPPPAPLPAPGPVNPAPTPAVPGVPPAAGQPPATASGCTLTPARPGATALPWLASLALLAGIRRSRDRRRQ